MENVKNESINTKSQREKKLSMMCLHASRSTPYSMENSDSEKKSHCGNAENEFVLNNINESNEDILHHIALGYAMLHVLFSSLSLAFNLKSNVARKSIHFLFFGAQKYEKKNCE